MLSKIRQIPRWAQALIILVAIGAGFLIWASLPDSEPAVPLTPATPAPTTAPLTTVVPATPIIGDTEGGCSEEQKRACKNMLCATDACAACCLDTEVGYSGTEATSPENVAYAQQLVEEAHEGLGNVWHSDIHSGQPDCSADCIAAINDAAAKTKEARSLLGSDILSMRTWDKNQTVAHAFDAAQYWIERVNEGETDSGDAAPHALFQLGILRDVLKQPNGEVGATGTENGPHTPTTNLRDAYNNIFQAHEGMSNVLKHNLEGSTCSERCIDAIADAGTKVVTAHGELLDDILLLRTWDHNQTVDHAFVSALYWWNRVQQFLDAEDGHRAVYQVGILRDMLDGALKNRNDGTEVGYSGTNPSAQTTPTANLRKAYNDIFQAHEGVANIQEHHTKTGSDTICEETCQAEYNDATNKINDARHNLSDDILLLHTWDHNQTVDHAFVSALFWLTADGQYMMDYDDAHHCLYQLGILRDMLEGELEKRN